MIVTSYYWYSFNLRQQFFFSLILQLFKAAGYWQNEVSASLSASMSKEKKIDEQEKSQVGQ